MTNGAIRKSIHRLAFLSMIEGIAVFFYLLFLRGGSGSGTIFAFSPARAALLGLTALLIVFFAELCWNRRLGDWAVNKLQSAWTRFALLMFAQTLILFGVALLRTLWLLFQADGDYQWSVAYQRLLPLVLWLILICLQTIGLLLFRFPAKPDADAGTRGRFRRNFLILSAIGGGLILFAFATGIGLSKENAFFGKPTVPLLEWHLAAACLLSLIGFIFTLRQSGNISSGLTRLLPLFIWAAAALIWLSIPNQNGFFSPAGRAPNFERYPFSDGAFYGHYARSLAAGMGFKGSEIPPRPLYIVALALFHRIAGTRYDSVILLQTLVLALLPALICQIGRELHSPAAGICAATLAILRETNAIYSAPFAHNVSSTQYFFADIPAALAAAFFVLMALRWLKARDNHAPKTLWYAALSGGTLGMMTLIRTQSLILFLLPVCFCLFGSGKMRRKLVQLVFFLLALAACLSPWLIRNHAITGQFVFDHPTTQTAEMTSSYNLGGLDMTREPGMNDGAYSDKLSQVLLTSIKRYPKEILTFISAHFLNNQLSVLRLFPLRGQLPDAAELLKPRTAFWETLANADLREYNGVGYALYFLMITFGIAAGMQRGAARGLLPILVLILFNLSTAVGRYSAGRYLIPIDWILFVYCGLAVAEWLRWVAARAGLPVVMDTAGEKPAEVKRFSWKKPALLVLLFGCIGATLPLAEKVIPMTFKPADKAQVLAKLDVDPLAYQSDSAVVMKAIAIYPRYYAAGEGEPESAKQGYGVADYGRLVFLTLSPGGFGTIELKTEQCPAVFPDGATVWLAGQSQGATTAADVIRLETADGVFLYKGARQSP